MIWRFSVSCNPCAVATVNDKNPGLHNFSVKNITGTLMKTGKKSPHIRVFIMTEISNWVRKHGCNAL